MSLSSAVNNPAPLHPKAHRLLDCLRRGDVPGAEQMVGQEDLSRWCADDSMWPLIDAASAAPSREALDWLVTRSVVPQLDGTTAFFHLQLTLEHASAQRLWYAHWLVENTPVSAHVKQRLEEEASATYEAKRLRVMDTLSIHALRRPDLSGLAWLMRPPAGFPAWRDDPTYPILSRALGMDRVFDTILRTRQIVYLLQEGVKPQVSPHPLDPTLPGTSPLQTLLFAYLTALERSRITGAPMAMNFSAMVTALWPPLVAAGDDPDRELSNNRTARQMLMETPEAGLALAHKRAVETSGRPLPSPRRPRIRT